MPEREAGGGSQGSDVVGPYELAALRRQIDGLDEQIVDLLNKRAAVSVEVGRLKQGPTPDSRLLTPVYAPEREAEVLRHIAEHSTGPLTVEALHAIYGEILSASRALQTPLTIAFLGPQNTFTHQAALAHFGRSTNFLPVATNPDVFKETELGRADYGIVAVENSTNGAVLDVLDSFVDTELKACAEVRVDVHQTLMSNVPLDQIKVVYSHPQSFGQCREWLRSHLPSVPLVDMASNGAAAERAAREQGAAALGPEMAARAFGLNVLESRAEDMAGNVTRFLVIGRKMAERSGQDRMALLFSIKDRVGVLRDVLALFASAGINLTKIESRPSKRRAWDYLFFADLDAHPDDPTMPSVLRDLQELTVFQKVLGAWRRTV